MKHSFITVILMCTVYIGAAQKVAAVSFANQYTFIDSTGKVKTNAVNSIEYNFADAKREVQLIKFFEKKKVEFNAYQKGNFKHHTMIFDHDSTASYSVSNYNNAKKQLYKRSLIKDNKWQISNSDVIILGYKTKVATTRDLSGKLYRVYYTDELTDFKIRYGQYGIPGFVLRYEVERSIFKGRGIDVATATNIDIYDGTLTFPNDYQIIEIKGSK